MDNIHAFLLYQQFGNRTGCTRSDFILQNFHIMIDEICENLQLQTHFAQLMLQIELITKVVFILFVIPSRIFQYIS